MGLMIRQRKTQHGGTNIASNKKQTIILKNTGIYTNNSWWYGIGLSDLMVYK